MSDEDDLVADMHDAHWEVANALGDAFTGSLAEGVRRIRTERDRLRALVGKCYTATFLGISPSGDHLSKTEQHTVPAVIQAALRCHVDKARAAEFERDRLRAVVDAARRWRTSHDRPLADLSAESETEHLAAVNALVTALDQLDGSGDMGGGDG